MVEAEIFNYETREVETALIPEEVVAVNSAVSEIVGSVETYTIGDLILVIGHAIEIQAAERCHKSFRHWMRSLSLHESLWPELQEWDQSQDATEAYLESCRRFSGFRSIRDDLAEGTTL